MPEFRDICHAPDVATEDKLARLGALMDASQASCRRAPCPTSPCIGSRMVQSSLGVLMDASQASCRRGPYPTLASCLHLCIEFKIQCGRASQVSNQKTQHRVN